MVGIHVPRGLYQVHDLCPHQGKAVWNSAGLLEGQGTQQLYLWDPPLKFQVPVFLSGVGIQQYSSKWLFAIAHSPGMAFTGH